MHLYAASKVMEPHQQPVNIVVTADGNNSNPAASSDWELYTRHAIR